MSLQNALETARIEQMLREQEEILKRSESKSESAVSKELKKLTVEEALQMGGVAQVPVTLNGKVVKFKIAVHRKDSTERLPEFKFHVKSALGNTVYIQAKDRKSAQAVVNEIFGKGRYVVSSMYL